MLRNEHIMWRPKQTYGEGDLSSTCSAKYLRAGIGINAAMKNANMLLNDVRNTLTPVVPRQ